MTDMNQYLDILSQKLIIDPIKKQRIEQSIMHLKKCLWGHFQARLSEIEVFGSYDRDTIIMTDINTDVDIIVVFRQKEVKPDTYLKQLKEFCEQYYQRSEIYQDYPTIVIDMDHIKFEVVPSYFVSDSIKKIPAPRSKEFAWINTAPKEFKNTLETKDRNHKGLIKPLIRILKYWNSLNGRPFFSFEIEKALLNKSYSCTTIKDYFSYASFAIIESATSELQKKICNELKERRRRIRILEENNMIEYIEAEFKAFLPFP